MIELITFEKQPGYFVPIADISSKEYVEPLLVKELLETLLKQCTGDADILDYSVFIEIPEEEALIKEEQGSRIITQTDSFGEKQYLIESLSQPVANTDKEIYILEYNY